MIIYNFYLLHKTFLAQESHGDKDRNSSVALVKTADVPGFSFPLTLDLAGPLV